MQITNLQFLTFQQLQVFLHPLKCSKHKLVFHQFLEFYTNSHHHLSPKFWWFHQKKLKQEGIYHLR